MFGVGGVGMVGRVVGVRVLPFLLCSLMSKGQFARILNIFKRSQQ